MQNKKFTKANKYITFGTAWNKYDEEGNFARVTVAIDPERNAKANGSKDGPGQGYKVYLVPVDTEGEHAGDAIEIKDFVLSPSSADKGKYPNAPDLRVWVGITE